MKKVTRTKMEYRYTEAGYKWEPATYEKFVFETAKTTATSPKL